MKIRIAATCAALWLAAVPLHAQQTDPSAGTPSATPAAEVPWTLASCIEYAQQNNTEVQQRALQVESSSIELSTARYSRLPDLNASVGGDASFGRALTSDNTYQSNNQTSGSLSVSASMPLFQGMRINHQIAAGKLNLAAAMQDLERIREDVAINVMTLYLQVLYAKEMVGISERQVELSTLQVANSRALASEGKQPESVIYESEALLANDRMSLTQARNDLQLALLDLSQALNRQSAAGFDIVVPTLDSLALESFRPSASADAIYDYAAGNRPHIKAEQLRLQSSEHNVDIARSALYPSLSLAGGYGTGVYSADETKFWAQMRHNSREYVGLSLGIPIFNRRASRNNIRSAQLAVRNQQLVLTAAEQALRKEIEQAWYNADAAYAKYRAADTALASSEVAFRYEQEKAAAGRSTVYDFSNAKTAMEKAQAEAAQAKYEFIFRSKILDYYHGKPLTL
ncbi:MAG TPA: TolC family protein [Candidatus Alistipes faecigallinarum]|nr:TolC family protein [Candidatus Alistipes faecigallinarum]